MGFKIDNPFGTCGLSVGLDLGFISGAQFSFNIDPMFADPCAVPAFLYRPGMTIGNLSVAWPNLRNFKAYHKGLVNWRLSRVHKNDHKGFKKRLPAGTDSRDPSERAAAYLRQKLNGGKLPSFSDVFRNMYGPPPKKEDFASEAEYEEAKERYSALKEQERKKDSAMRAIAEKVVGDWMDDPRARSEFARRMSMARTPAERARALLDPKGDGAYLQHLGQFLPGLTNANDYEGVMKNWEKAAGWLSNEFGENAMAGLINEAGAQVNQRGYPASTPIDREAALKKFTDRGYTREEAEGVLCNFGSMEQVDEAARYLREIRGSEQIEAQQRDIDAKKREFDEMKDPKNWPKLQQSFQTDAKAKAIEEKQLRQRFEEDTEQYRRELAKLARAIDESGRSLADLKRRRAEFFMQEIMGAAPIVFGRTAEEMGYRSGQLPEGVWDVSSAIEWLNTGRVSTRAPLYASASDIPPAPAPAQAAETPRAEETPAAGGGNGVNAARAREVDGPASGRAVDAPTLQEKTNAARADFKKRRDAAAAKVPSRTLGAGEYTTIEPVEIRGVKYNITYKVDGTGKVVGIPTATQVT